jgi:hypothetical protein
MLRTSPSFTNEDTSAAGMRPCANSTSRRWARIFTERTLTPVGSVKIRQFGPDAAVAEFDWDFVAKRADNGELLHTTGRESEVFAKLPELG